MKIIIISNLAVSLPVIDIFQSSGSLLGVISGDKLHSHNLQLADFCLVKKIPFFKVGRKSLEESLHQLFIDLEPDLVLMMGFTYRIPKALFNFPPLGFYNVHFSLLPAYQGPDPIFWQLKNGETLGGITIHRVNSDFDSGEIVLQQEIPFIRGENWGICNSRYALPALNLIKTLVNQLAETGAPLPYTPVGVKQSYFARTTPNDFIINWDIQTAAEIEALVNACNPLAGGAITSINQQPVRIFEVSPVDGTGNAELPAGTVLQAGENGLFVQCINNSVIRINILKLNEGFMTGFKLAALGIQAGACFESHQLQLEELITS